MDTVLALSLVALLVVLAEVRERRRWREQVKRRAELDAILDEELTQKMRFATNLGERDKR